MKIGVALSGCGIGDLTLCSALYQMKNNGIDISQISTTKELCLSALLFACGCPAEEALPILRLKSMDGLGILKWWRKRKWRKKLEILLTSYQISDLKDLPIPISIMVEDKEKGRVTAFSSLFKEENEASNSWGYFFENEQNALKIIKKLHPFLEKGRYQDPTYRIGYPTYPLKIQKMDRILCMEFVSSTQMERESTSNEAMNCAMRHWIRNDASMQLSFFEPLSKKCEKIKLYEWEEMGKKAVDKHLLALYDALLF